MSLSTPSRIYHLNQLTIENLQCKTMNPTIFILTTTTQSMTKTRMIEGMKSARVNRVGESTTAISQLADEDVARYTMTCICRIVNGDRCNRNVNLASTTDLQLANRRFTVERWCTVERQHTDNWRL